LPFNVAVRHHLDHHGYRQAATTCFSALSRVPLLMVGPALLGLAAALPVVLANRLLFRYVPARLPRRPVPDRRRGHRLTTTTLVTSGTLDIGALHRTAATRCRALTPWSGADVTK
jgi:hypothetical protein